MYAREGGRKDIRFNIYHPNWWENRNMSKYWTKKMKIEFPNPLKGFGFRLISPKSGGLSNINPQNEKYSAKTAHSTVNLPQN